MDEPRELKAEDGGLILDFSTAGKLDSRPLALTLARTGDEIETRWIIAIPHLALMKLPPRSYASFMETMESLADNYEPVSAQVRAIADLIDEIERMEKGNG